METKTKQAIQKKIKNITVDHEALKTGAVVSQLTDAIKAEINDLLTDGVVTTSEIVGGIFLTGDQLLGMEQLAVSSGADLINDGGLEIDEDGTCRNTKILKNIILQLNNDAK